MLNDINQMQSIKVTGIQVILQTFKSANGYKVGISSMLIFRDGISVNIGYRISAGIKYRTSDIGWQKVIGNIGYRLQSNIGHRISARNQPIAFPSRNAT